MSNPVYVRAANRRIGFEFCDKDDPDRVELAGDRWIEKDRMYFLTRPAGVGVWYLHPGSMASLLISIRWRVRGLIRKAAQKRKSKKGF